MNYLPSAWTYGVELEYADVDRGRGKLPPGSVWNRKDYTICNTNGVGNDPLGKLWRWGGEINTKPTRGIDDQLEVIRAINRRLDPAPAITYRCNLHCHVGIEGLRDDLPALKRVERYFKTHAKTIFRLIQKVPSPTPWEYPRAAAYAAALARYKRRLRSHQWVTPDSVYERVIAADTPSQFFDAYAPEGKRGALHHLAIRSAVNLRQLLETGTIEFRHFAGTASLPEIETALQWCRGFLDAALNDPDTTPPEILKGIKCAQFPKFVPYSHDQEEIYRLTNFGDNSREAVARNLAQLRAEGKIT